MSEIISQIRDNKIILDLNKSVYINTNYLRLSNKPSINGVELSGNLTSNDLNLLSNDKDSYTQIDLESAEKTDFLLVLGQEGTPKKLKLGEITSRAIQTVSILPDNLPVGSYVFLLKEDL